MHHAKIMVISESVAHRQSWWGNAWISFLGCGSRIYYQMNSDKTLLISWVRSKTNLRMCVRSADYSFFLMHQQSIRAQTWTHMGYRSQVSIHTYSHMLPAIIPSFHVLTHTSPAPSLFFLHLIIGKHSEHTLAKQTSTSRCFIIKLGWHKS